MATPAAIRAGRAAVEIDGDDTKLREATKRSVAYLKEVGKASKQVGSEGGESGGFLQALALRAKNARREARSSGESALEKAISSGGGLTTFGLRSLGIGLPAMIANEIGANLSEMTKKAIELRKEFNEGKKGAGQIAEELAGSIPILGNFWKLGRNIRELFTGEEADLAEIKKQGTLVTKEMYAARDATNAYHEALKSVKATLEEIARRRELIGKTPDEQARILAQQSYDKGTKSLADERDKEQNAIISSAGAADRLANERKRSAEKTLEELAKTTGFQTDSRGNTSYVEPSEDQKAAAMEAMRVINEVEKSKRDRAQLTKRRLEELDAQYNEASIAMAKEKDEKIKDLDEKNLLEIAKKEEELAEEEGRLMNERNEAKWKAEEDHQKEIIGYMDEAGRAAMEHNNEEIDAKREIATEVEREQIKASKKGLDQRLALLELERREALRVAKERHVDTAAGINAKFDLMRQMELDRGYSASGSFSAAQIEASSGGMQRLDDIAKATKETAKNTREIKQPAFQ